MTTADPPTYYRPSTRGELRDKILEGVPCEIVGHVVESTNLMFRGWLQFHNFKVRASENPGWAVYERKYWFDDPTYYPVRCPVCKWEGMSDQSEGGTAIADTGDHSDIVCPECFKQDNWIPLEDIDPNDPSPVWKVM